MGAFKPWHIVVLLLVVLLLFGAGKLPTLARNVGKSMRIFKTEVEELRGDEQDDRDDDDRPRDRDRRFADDRDRYSGSRAYDPRDEREREPVRARDEDDYRRD